MIALVSLPVCGGALSRTSWSDAAIQFARTIAEGRFREAANEMLLPSSIDPGAAKRERDQIGSAIERLLTMLGAMSEIKTVDEKRSFYEFIIGGGPRPYWWRDDHGTERDVLLAVRFGVVGDGLLRITLVRVDDRAVVAAFGVGLDTSRSDAKQEVLRLRDSIYDLFDLPADHPMRSADLTPVESSNEEALQ